MSSISSLENELARLKAALGGEPMPSKKSRKSPTGEKKEPNVWIKFTMRVEAILAAAKAAAGTDEEALAPFKGPATIAKQFASFLKDTKAYDEWTDDAILEAFRTWTRPEQSKMAAAGKTKSAKNSVAGSDGDDSVTSEKKERKKPAPKTPEEQAAINAKRAATKAAKKEATGTLEVLEAATPADAPAAAPKTFKKKVPTATQVKESWEPMEGTEYGVNMRGEVADEDGNYIGKRLPNGSIDKTIPKPADWEQITP